MRIRSTRYLVQNLKSRSFQITIKNCIGSDQRALFSTSIALSKKGSSGIRSNPKIDEFFPNVVDFPNRHIGPRKHETQVMCNELGYNVSFFKAIIIRGLRVLEKTYNFYISEVLM